MKNDSNLLFLVIALAFAIAGAIMAAVVKSWAVVLVAVATIILIYLQW